jgi:membrane-bound lytic murein transglycosylase A
VARLFLFLLITACAIQPQRDNLLLTQVGFDSLHHWQHDDHKHAFNTFKISCRKLLLAKDHKWHGVCNKAMSLDTNHPNKYREFFEENFTPFLASNNGKDKGLFTGYYEVELHGSRKKTAKYKYPIYRAPRNLEQIKKKLSHHAINHGALKNKNLEILYVDDRVELFFMHIQGSGKIKLTDGTVVRLGYAAQNGYPYYAIGRYLIDYYKIDPKHISAEFIKAWLRANHDQAQAVMEKNESYVFFRELDSKDGPIGGQAVPLTAERSLAIDKKFLKYGTPIWLETEYPSTDCDNQTRGTGKPFRKLMVAQDTGGAIKGPVRGDIFFGTGKHASLLASCMKNSGKYYLLLPNTKPHF